MAKAEAVSGKSGLKYTNGGDIWRFPCPLDNGNHDWNGVDPQAWVVIEGGEIKCGCRKCTPKPANGASEAYQVALLRYTEDVKAAIGWNDEGNVHRVKFGFEELRHHDYETFDGKWIVRHHKYKANHGNAEPRWGFKIKSADQPESVFNQFKVFSPGEWKDADYPAFGHYYHVLHLYGHRRFVGEYRPVVCEGEKDADTFNRLMAAAGCAHLVATALPDQKPDSLAPHQEAFFAGRDVVIITDNDEGGEQSALKWCAVLWSPCLSVKVFPSARFGTKLVAKGKHKGEDRGRDLTEWAEARAAEGATDAELGKELVDVLTSTQPLGEPIARPQAWRSKLAKSKNGVLRDSAGNAAVVVVEHPDLAGRFRRNLRSGEVEVVDPPWARGVQAGARDIADALSIWLETTDHEQLHLSRPSFEAAVNHLAAPYNPLDELLSTEWDGIPRIDALFTRYVPLNVEPAIAVALARIMVCDLTRKMRNEMIGQRVLVGIETDLSIDLAGALMGRHGFQHRGKIGDRQIGQFAGMEAIFVQTSMEPVANRQAALASLPCLFSPYAIVGNRRISSPLFIAVGEGPKDPRTAAKTDDRCFLYDLAGRPLLDALRDDAAMLVAEAAVKVDELAALAVPSKERTLTLDAREAIEAVRHTLTGLHLYVTRDVMVVDTSSVTALLRAPEREQPLRHVVRDQFLQTMRAWMFDAYRDVLMQERAFNDACRAMGWVKTGRPVAINLTPKTAAAINFPIGKRDQVCVMGILVTDERLADLGKKLFNVDSPPPPKGGGGAGSDGAALEQPAEAFDTLDSSYIGQNPSQTVALDSNMEGFLHMEENILNQGIESESPRADTRVLFLRKKEGWVSGAEALDAVRAILAQPGDCAVDFETAPGDPAWFADQAAARAPRGQKGAARQRATHDAVAGNRAKQRQACTLQLHHEGGDEVFVRLTDPMHELPLMFDGCAATLCAHNAQFEVEVLAKHGVWLDVECTMIAAKCLHLVAVPQDAPQPVSFSLADLVQREFGRTRDKTIRARDWSDPAALDAEAVEYGLQDARDCLELWRLYERRLRDEGLFDGYRVMQGSLLPTAAINLTGLTLDAEAHAALIGRMEAEAQRLEADLDRICLGAVDNHGSTQQVATFIMEEVLQVPIKPPTEPKLVDLLEFLKARGRVRPDPGGELAALDLPRGVVDLAGSMSLWDATLAAWEAGYVRHDLSTFGDEQPDERDLLAALDEARHGPVLTVEDAATWRAHLEQRDHFDRLHRDDPYRLSHFVMRLHAATNGAVKGWRTTKTGHLAITKGSKLRRAEQLAGAFPVVSEYLVKHAQWTKATKLIDGFGASLRRWQDDDGRVRGQAKVFGAWTGRQACVDPNLTNQPREDEFRALWVALKGRKLVVADYNQIELRLAAVESGDERLREVYREGRDVHAETASIIMLKMLDEVTKADRQPAKGVNFLSVYGGGAAKLAETIGCSLEHAHAILARFFAAYPGLAKYRETAPQAASASGHIEIRPCRRVAYVEGTSSPTQAINSPIQGGAASVQMRALRLVHDGLQERAGATRTRDAGLRLSNNQANEAERALAASRAFLEASEEIKLAASVHDEIILDCAEGCADEAAELLVRCMTTALVEIYPEAEEQGLARLTAATICDRWSEKA